ncbi:MAG: hypothetical protein WAX89_05370 [Alphaproteobacteria bacterium]
MVKPILKHWKMVTLAMAFSMGAMQTPFALEAAATNPGTAQISNLLAQFEQRLTALKGVLSRIASESRKNLDCRLNGKAYNYSSGVCVNTTIVTARDYCNSARRFYQPGHPEADGNGCVGLSATLNNPTVYTNIVASSLYADTSVPRQKYKCSRFNSRHSWYYRCSTPAGSTYAFNVETNTVTVTGVTCSGEGYQDPC